MNFQYSAAEYIQNAAYCSNLDCGGFRKAERSADFPVRSNSGTFYGAEKFCIAFFYTLLRTGESALRAPFFNVRESAVNGCSEDRGIADKSTRSLPARKSIQKTEFVPNSKSSLRTAKGNP